MRKYYLFNFNETKEIFVGNFQTDEEFWKHYKENEKEINEKKNKLDKDCGIWHFDSF